MYYEVTVIENPAYKGIMTVVFNRGGGGTPPWAAYVNFQRGATSSMIYNTFFIDFEINVFLPIVWLSSA